MKVSQKIKIIIHPAIPLLDIPQRVESRYSYRCLCLSLHSFIIHNSEKAEVTHMSITRWVDNNLVHTDNGILFSLKKEGKT